jgi:hypothetical protein
LVLAFAILPAVAFIVGIGFVAQSGTFWLTIAGCFTVGCVLTSVLLPHLALHQDDNLPIALASYAPLFIGFGMFAVTGGTVFIIGLFLFLLGVAVCGGQLALALSVRSGRRAGV